MRTMSKKNEPTDPCEAATRTIESSPFTGQAMD